MFRFRRRQHPQHLPHPQHPHPPLAAPQRPGGLEFVIRDGLRLRIHPPGPGQRLPLIKRLLHGMFLTVLPFLLSRAITRFFFNPDVAGSGAAAAGAAAAAVGSTATSNATTGTTLVEKFILILATELNIPSTDWVPKMAGIVVFVLYSSSVTLILSFSALFYTLCFIFIIGKKWNTIFKFALTENFRDLGIF